MPGGGAACLGGTRWLGGIGYGYGHQLLVRPDGRRSDPWRWKGAASRPATTRAAPGPLAYRGHRSQANPLGLGQQRGGVLGVGQGLPIGSRQRGIARLSWDLVAGIDPDVLDTGALRNLGGGDRGCELGEGGELHLDAFRRLEPRGGASNRDTFEFL